MKHFLPKPFQANDVLCLTSLLLITTLTVLPSCKKNSTTSIPQKLMNKWTVVQTADTFYSSTGSPQITAYPGKSGDYMDFRTDGKRYSFVNNKYDTAGYTFSEMNLNLNVQSYHYNILVLTDETMVLYDPHYTTATVGYTASKVTLKK